LGHYCQRDVLVVGGLIFWDSWGILVLSYSLP
jgi:hypothetical protein